MGGLPARADIVDRNGVPLARTMDAYSIAVRPSKLIGDPSELARKLHEIFPDEPAATFYKKLTGRGWAYLRRSALPEGVRSEEHTSEPQSLMRISYAGFCLNKKTRYNNTRI